MGVVVVAGSAGMAWAALTDPRPEEFSWPKGLQWCWVGLWLICAGDAAFGENRWWFERTWKGTAAALLVTSVVVEAWRYHLRRRRAALLRSEPTIEEGSGRP